MSRSAHWFAIAWTVLVSAFLLFGPVYSGRSTTPGTDGTMVESTEPGRSLLEVNGPRALIAVAFPLAFVLVPLLARDPTLRRQLGIFSVILLVALVLIGGFSIGLFYLPSAIAMLVFVLSMRKPPEPSSSTAVGTQL